MDASNLLSEYLKSQPATGKVVDFDPGNDRLYHFDLTAGNHELNAGLFTDTDGFNRWITHNLQVNKCTLGIGGYMENRIIYSRSVLFDGTDEPRRLHLGVDIWGKVGTPVYSPLPGVIHSFKDNDNFGDYGPTLILQHDLEGLTLFTLYGHLSREGLVGLKAGRPVPVNEKIGNFGDMDENGAWPPHLHFQLMLDMEGKKGDYPGVCRVSEKEKYLKNVPDPQLLLKLPHAVNR